jgi:hypothetical protein
MGLWYSFDHGDNAGGVPGFALVSHMVKAAFQLTA